MSDCACLQRQGTEKKKRNVCAVVKDRDAMRSKWDGDT